MKDIGEKRDALFLLLGLPKEKAWKFGKGFFRFERVIIGEMGSQATLVLDATYCSRKGTVYLLRKRMLTREFLDTITLIDVGWWNGGSY